MLLLVFNRHLIVLERSLGPLQFWHYVWVSGKCRLLHIAAENMNLMLIPWKLWFALAVRLRIDVGTFSFQDIFWFISVLVWWILRGDDRLVVFIGHSVLMEAFEPRGVRSPCHFSFVHLEGIYLSDLRVLVVTVWWDYRRAGLFCCQYCFIILLVIILIFGQKLMLMLHVQRLGYASVSTLCKDLWHPGRRGLLLVCAELQLQRPVWLSLDTYNAQVLAFPDASAWSHEFAYLALRTGLHSARWRPTQRRSPLRSWRDISSLYPFPIFVCCEWAIVWVHILLNHNLKIKYILKEFLK